MHIITYITPMTVTKDATSLAGTEINCRFHSLIGALDLIKTLKANKVPFTHTFEE